MCKTFTQLYLIICVQMNTIYNFRKLVKILIFNNIIIIKWIKIFRLNLYIIFNINNILKAYIYDPFIIFYVDKLHELICLNEKLLVKSWYIGREIV
jgi:hypothetical protein